MNDRYVLKCIAIRDSDTFGFKKNDVFYYNREACEMRVKPYQNNPYEKFVRSSYVTIPFTSNIDSAKIWQKTSFPQDLMKDIEKVGHFKCKLVKVKLIEITNNI